MFSWKITFEKITCGTHLTSDESAEVMNEIMEGRATPAQIGFLTGSLRMKGETPEEIFGFAKAMRQKSIKVTPKSKNLVDTCGTGGDAVKTFNLSTAAAFVASSAGAVIAKHGNRAFTSKCGSADVLEALGARLDLTPEKTADCIDIAGIGFLFAPQHHPALKHAGPSRQEIGVRTFFNLLGPLTNPANAVRQFMGVYDARLVKLAAETLVLLGCERGLIVHGSEGLDEISPIGETQAAIIEHGKITYRTLTPNDFGCAPCKLSALQPGEDAEQSANILKLALSPEISEQQSAILPNSAGAIWVSGLADDFKTACDIARETIQSGKAYNKVIEFVSTTNNLT